MRRFAWLLVLVACKGTQPVAAEPPEDVTFVAVVELNASGEVAATGPLTAWDPSAPLFVAARRDGDVRLVGFSDATLAANGILDALRAGEDRLDLEPAIGCAPRLPDADWIGSWGEDGVRTLADATTPALTASALDRVCPGFSPDVAIDVPCLEPRCVPTIVSRSDCAVTVSLDCRPGTMTVRVDPAGRVCAELPTAFGACPLESTAPGVGRHACDGCRVDVHVPLDDAPMAFVVEKVKLVEGPLRQPRDIEVNRQPFRYNFYEGYIHDVVTLDDRVVVLAPELGYGKRCDFGVLEIDKRLFFLDPDTLTVTSSRATETCLTAVTRDARGDGFVGVFGRMQDWSIGRFAADGTLLASAAFDPDRFGDGYSDGGIHELHFTEDLSKIVVMANVHFQMQNTWGGIRTFDADTLEPLERFFYPPHRIEYATPGPGDTLYAFESGDVRTWFTIDLVRGDIQELEPLAIDQMLRSSLFAVMEHRGQLLAVGRGHDAAFAYDLATDSEWSATAFQTNLHAFTMAPWPADPSLVIVGGGIETFYDGALMLLDTAERRFRYTYVEGVSESSVTRFEPDGRGGVLAMFPWTGEIARVTAP